MTIRPRLSTFGLEEAMVQLSSVVWNPGSSDTSRLHHAAVKKEKERCGINSNGGGCGSRNNSHNIRSRSSGSGFPHPYPHSRCPVPGGGPRGRRQQRRLDKTGDLQIFYAWGL
ncbi:hypothetical protein U0070_026845 [Myodes glareolus]|uniref:Uncharacterized protein n=1 Tax=Myodes glareolus TaxID=447135 RepID=A0AAW0K2E5_MYOGA